jgi:hypothetical protein
VSRSFFCLREFCRRTLTRLSDHADTHRRVWFAVELLASIFTLTGIYLGSTTFAGAALYLVALGFWFVLCAAKRLWGLMPLNIASAAVSIANLWRAVA